MRYPRRWRSDHRRARRHGGEDIDDKVATLTGTGWESVAAQAYSDAHQQWMTGAREFAEGVREMSAAARKAHTRYSTAAEADKQMLQRG
ncbi:WXG100 family type VII secretion target [Nocardia vinacea]|uniref:WXG100 family type VII secretion target n=1 Tax=Nocardia vinacea TaxID=96468 RepID=UPI002E0D1ED4|nr:WXG100 family type VII secretion target [Nocardia vinacea]